MEYTLKMFHKASQFKTNYIKKQQGGSLIMAVFMIVVFSMMATVMVKIVSSSSQSISYEVLGTRAYAAAKTGNQWALQQLFPLNSTGNCDAVNENTPPSIVNIKGLDDCHLTSVVCTPVAEGESVFYFSITSTGVCSLGEVSTSRTLKVDARSL